MWSRAFEVGVPVRVSAPGLRWRHSCGAGFNFTLLRWQHSQGTGFNFTLLLHSLWEYVGVRVRGHAGDSLPRVLLPLNHKFLCFQRSAVQSSDLHYEQGLFTRCGFVIYGLLFTLWRASMAVLVKI